MIGTPGFIAERLVQAREARGLSAVALAEMIGVKSANISQYEHRKQTPSPDVMDRIVQVLNCPRSFFLRPASQSQTSCIWYRSMSIATKTVRTRAEARFGWLKEIVSYLGEFLDFPKMSIPDFVLPTDLATLSPETIEEIATECRRFWRLGDGPIADLLLVLENNGIVIASGELGTEALDSFSQWSAEDVPYIFLNSDKASAVRLRFDVAHELGHLLFHKNISGQQFRNTTVHRVLENQCHRFALALLLPAQRFSTELWAPTLNGFRSIKERWGVSMAGMIKRCEQLGILDDEQSKRMWINLSRHGWRKWEPLDDEILPERPRLLPRSIELLIDSGIKSKQQILLDLALSASDIEDLACLPPGFMTDSGSKPLVMPKRDESNPIQGKKRGTLLGFSKRQAD